MRHIVSVAYLAVLPRLPVSSRPANRNSAYRTRYLDAVPVVQPNFQPIARVAVPSAARRTIRARWRNRCPVFVERTKPSSSARSATVNVMASLQQCDSSNLETRLTHWR
jgi:hypothetical protein